MNIEVWLKISCVLVVILAILYLWRVRQREQLYRYKGWNLILAGLSLVFFASLLDISHYFYSSDRFSLQWLPGILQLGGLILLFIGLARWFPTIFQLRRSETKLRALYDSTSDAVMLLDQKGFFDCNNATLILFGCATLEEFCSKHPADLSPPAQPGGASSMELANQRIATAMEKGCHRFDWVHKRADTGKTFHAEVLLTAMNLEGKPVLYAVVRDITERKAAEEEVQRLAFHDLLTQLPNRRLLMDRLQHALSSSIRHGRDGALLFIDLDNFKTLNDTLGHNIGDLLLQQVAQRLVTCLRKGDTVARLGGDEFVVMLEGLSENLQEAAFQAEAIGDKIIAALNQPYQLAGYDCRSTPSIGIALFTNQQISAEELMKRADIAMYQAKKAGRNTIRFFDPEMQAAVEARSTLERWMQQALPQRQFRLYYQMQVDHKGTIFGAEMLLRWQHPERGMILPADFIPLAEENGLIESIGLWVLETACNQLKAWEACPVKRHFQLAINVSARQFRQPSFVEQVIRVLDATRIVPNRLKFELTESLVLDNVADAITRMQTLKDIGVQFSMDDFGTGYSSLSHLKKLPLDQLKIDQVFVRDIVTNHDDAIIVQTIIAMAKNLGMEVIAEGVETNEQRDFLIERNCLNFQGYLFSRPVSLEKFEQLVDQIILNTPTMEK